MAAAAMAAPKPAAEKAATRVEEAVEATNDVAPRQMAAETAGVAAAAITILVETEVEVRSKLAATRRRGARSSPQLNFVTFHLEEGQLQAD